MKVILINKLLCSKGGDAISTLETGMLLKRNGHEVFSWGMDAPENPEYAHRDYFVSHVGYNTSGGLAERIRVTANILYALEAKRKLYALMQKVKPDIVHLNNFAHQLSPSRLNAIKKPQYPHCHDQKGRRN